MHYNTQTLDKQTLNTPHSSSTRWCMLLVLIVNFHYYLLMLSTGYYHSKGRVGSRIIGRWIGRHDILLWFHIIACRPIIDPKRQTILTYNISHYRAEHDSDIILVIVYISYDMLNVKAASRLQFMSSNFGVFLCNK